MNPTYIMSGKYESRVFGLRRPKMSLTAISSLESASTKFFMNPTYIMSRNTHQLARIGEKKIFHDLVAEHV